MISSGLVFAVTCATGEASRRASSTLPLTGVQRLPHDSVLRLVSGGHADHGANVGARFLPSADPRVAAFASGGKERHHVAAGRLNEIDAIGVDTQFSAWACIHRMAHNRSR
jgi:hypothetical protein